MDFPKLLDIWGVQWVDTEAKHSLKSKIQHRCSESLGRICCIAAPPPLEASFLPNPCPPLRQIRTLKGLLHPYWKIKTVLLGGSSLSGKTQVPACTLMLSTPLNIQHIEKLVAIQLSLSVYIFRQTHTSLLGMWVSGPVGRRVLAPCGVNH